MTREQIYGALFAKLSAIPGVVTASRRLLHWSDVSPASQPSLFQVQKSETVTQQSAFQAVWKFHIDLYLYAFSPDSNVSGSTILNPIVDLIEQALSPPDGMQAQTLGGLVKYCHIVGQIITDEGVLGQQAVAVIPVEILVNS